MKKYYILFIFILHGLISTAQINFQSGFGDTVADYGTKVVKITTGGYLVIGPTGVDQTNNADVAIYFANQIGEMNSSVKIGLNKDEYPSGLVETAGGGFIISGTTYSSPLDTLNSDIFVAKINSTGDVLWSNVYGTTNEDNAESLFKTPEGNFIISGSTSNSANTLHSALVIKINENGDVIWSNTYKPTASTYFFQGDITFDNQYVFGGGAFTGTNDENYIVKTDTAGNVRWEKSFGTTGADWIRDIKSTSDSGFIIAGISSENTAGDTDQCIIKLDSVGSINWAYNYGTVGYDRSFSVIENSIQHYIVCGYSNISTSGGIINQMVMEEIENSGNIVWANIYGDSVETSEGYYVINGIDDGYAAVGYSVAYGDPNGDVDLVKTDNFGVAGCDEFPLFLTRNTAQLFEGTPDPSIRSSILLNQQSVAMISEPFTNSYAQNCVFDYIKDDISSKNSDKQFVKLFPNPTENLLNIEMDFGEAVIVIYDQLGRVVSDQKISASKSSIDVSFLAPGFYHLQLKSGNNLAEGRFIKE